SLLFCFQCAEFDLIFSNQQIHIFAVLQLSLISLFDFVIASADFGLNPFSAQFGDFRPFVQRGFPDVCPRYWRIALRAWGKSPCL
ncbi:hypothetical protein, partial [Klebsiella variicola]|uniref:hypothetical protein n=1 Tax=Klebsiella variicola TaxID=244366 RepID=UPI001C450F13